MSGLRDGLLDLGQVAVEMPMPAILPSSRSATISASWSSSGTCWSAGSSCPSISRRFTAPSRSTEAAQVVLDRRAQLLGTLAGSQPPSSSRKAPTFDTSTRSSG